MPSPLQTLTPSQEALYRQWMQQIGQTRAAGQNVDNNFTGGDYDYRGYFLKYGPSKKAKGEHFTDEFKLPNHETFSDESIYAVGADRAKAGHWNGDTYIPARKVMPNYDYPIPLDPNTMQPLPMGSMSSSSLGQQPNFRWQAQAGNQFRGLMGNQDLALALLANSGPSPYKRSFGEILGTSGIQAQQMKSQREEEQFKRAYMVAQMQALQGRGQRKPIAVLDESGKPVLVDEQDAIGKQPYAGGNDAKPSALIQAYNLATTQGFKGSILEFQEQLAKASAQYPYALGEQGGVPTMFPRVTPNAPSQPQAPGTVTAPIPTRPLSTLDAEANAKNRLAAAGAYGAETGQATGKAAFDLPRVEGNVTQAVEDIDKLIKHPGLSYITGLYSKAPIVPGTPQAGADALAKQVQGQTFLQAYNSLKGGGAITETEGIKAESAIARLSRAQDTAEYVEALEDLKKVLDRGLKKARKQAGEKESPDKKDPLGIR